MMTQFARWIRKILSSFYENTVFEDKTFWWKSWRHLRCYLPEISLSKAHSQRYRIAEIYKGSWRVLGVHRQKPILVITIIEFLNHYPIFTLHSIFYDLARKWFDDWCRLQNSQKNLKHEGIKVQPEFLLPFNI